MEGRCVLGLKPYGALCPAGACVAASRPTAKYVSSAAMRERERESEREERGEPVRNQVVVIEG